MQKPLTPPARRSSLPLSDPFASPAAPSPAAAPPIAWGRGAWGRGVGAATVFALILLAVLFQWNWLRGPLGLYLSGRLNRAVAIRGDLTVHPWSARPWAVVRGLSVGQPGWAAPEVGSRAMIEVPAATVEWRWGSLLGGRAELPLVRIERPSLNLQADGAGRHDWDFPSGGAPGRRPAIGRLVITGGRVGLHDAEHGVDFRGTLASDETAGGGGASRLEGALTVAAAPWAGPAPLVRAPHLLIEARLLDALGGHLTLPLVVADAPAIRALRDAAGRESWRLSAHPQPVKLPPIGRLIISDGSLAYDDARMGLTFRGVVSSREALAGAGGGAFRLEGRGALNRQPFAAAVSGGALVRVDPRRPYPFQARVEAGATRIAVSAAFLHPFDFNRLAGRGSVSGPDFADLYRLTGVALPSTPPYALSAGFARSGETWAFRRLSGRVGASDLAGSVTAARRGGRPFVSADLASRRLLLSDLAAVIGGAPAKTAGRPLSPAQQAMAARLRAEHRVLPDAHLDLTRLRASDAELTYHAASVDAGKLPIRALSLKLALDRGLLTVDPLAMSLPRGVFAGSVRLDGRGATPAEAVDFRLTGARLEDLVGRGGGPPALGGALVGRARLSATGDSVRAAAAHADGTVSLAIPGGEIRQAFAELLGIDATKGLFLLVARNHGATPIRCGVADFTARDGVFTAQRIVLDTGVVLATGQGDIDLRDESLRLSLAGKPKKFRLIRIGAPITLTGDLAAPKVGVAIGKAIPQLAIGAVLGAVAAPIAAVLPFVNPGAAKDADCAALLRQTAAAAPRLAAAASRPGRPSGGR